MAVYVSEEILDFLTGIHVKRKIGNCDNRKNRLEAIFDTAFYKAYGDMWTHTAEYKPLPEYIGKTQDESGKKKNEDNIVIRYNKRDIREVIKDYIKKDFKVVKDKDESGFIKWHEDICEKITKLGEQCTVELVAIENKNIFYKGRKENKNIPNIEDLGEYEFVKKVLEREKGLKTKTFRISEIIKHAHIDGITFSVGQAQKLVNMMLKYLYIYCNCEGIYELNNVSQYFHCPIDSYVLQEAFTKDEEEYELSWCKINDYTDYKKLQDEILKRVKNEYKTAFKWELAEWPFQ